MDFAKRVSPVIIDLSSSLSDCDESNMNSNAPKPKPKPKSVSKSNSKQNPKPNPKPKSKPNAHDDNQTMIPIYSLTARKLMSNMGHIPGKGLGPHHNGISSPIQAQPQNGPSNCGLGYSTAEPLNSKQTDILRSVERGDNVFLTGPAGTGKSVVLRRVVQFLGRRYRPWEWTVVAPTGIAAVHLGGQTIHRFSGVGVPVLEEDFGKAWGKGRGGNGGSRKRWKNLKVLVVDEVSMISGEFFDRLSTVVGEIRNEPDMPFGGIQLVLSGDFLQLPPIVNKAHELKNLAYSMDNNTNSNNTNSNTRHKPKRKKLFDNQGFAFQATAWKKAALKTTQLDEVFRQTNTDFIRVLHEIRLGKVSPTSEAFLKSCDRPLSPTDLGIEPTVLYAKNRGVDDLNRDSLHRLPGEEHLFEAVDSVQVEYGEDGEDRQYRSRHEDEDELRSSDFFEKCIAAQRLCLKEGA